MIFLFIALAASYAALIAYLTDTHRFYQPRHARTRTPGYQPRHARPGVHVHIRRPVNGRHAFRAVTA